MTYAWLAAIIAFVAIEAMTSQLVSVWFAGGALAAFIGACFGTGITIQWILFVATSALLLILTKPFVKKITGRTPEKTNTEAHIGKTTIVTRTIDNIKESGEVKINGVSWSARSDDESVIEDGEKVIIKRIEGVRLIVSRI